MQDTPETLQSALDDLTRRVAAFEKAQAPEEPPALTEDEMDAYKRTPDHFCRESHKAAARLRWCEPELARLREENAALREAQEPQPDDYSDESIVEYARRDNTYAIEIARRRGLTVAK